MDCRDNSLPPPFSQSTQSHPVVQLVNTDNPDAYVKKLQWSWAKGPHLEFLNDQLPSYCASLSECPAKASEQLNSIINSYFQHFPWRLKVMEDPDTPYDPLVHPLTDLVCEIEIEQKQHKIMAMQKMQKFKRCAKLENDEWARYLVQLSGLLKTKPKALQPHQCWSKDHFDDIVNKDFHKWWKKAGLPLTCTKLVWCMAD
ncbi:hypothetical protein BD769DRAFT_1388905 [Suillus cothurnatus]|nr:hypothetical protein BD769DRAFT_1388905 [Suillus cothurnatus]